MIKLDFVGSSGAAFSEERNEKFASRILGGFFDNLLFFFFRIFKYVSEISGTSYVAFVTRRCQVLMQIFLGLIRGYMSSPGVTERYPWLTGLSEDEINEIAQNQCITDINLRTIVTKVEAIYNETGIFPKIIIVDELFLLGRTLSQLILRVESPFAHDNLLREKFLNSLDIFIFAQNNDTKMMPARHRKRIVARDIWEIVELSDDEARNLSMRLSRLVSVSGVSNVGYSWSLRLPVTHRRKLAIFQDVKFSSRSRWHMETTRIHNIRQDTYIWLYPSPKDVRAICTVRQKTSSFEINGRARQMYVPYLMFNTMPYSNAKALHERFLSDMLKQGRTEIVRLIDYTLPCFPKTNQFEYYSRICEQNSLILGYMMLRDLLRNLGFGNEIFAPEKILPYVDLDQLARNYSWISKDPDSSLGQLQNARDALAAIWYWDPPEGLMEEYLSILLKDVPSMLDSEFAFTDTPVRNTENVLASIYARVQDAIADIAYDAEISARMRLKSNIIFSDEALARWGYDCTLKLLLEKCSDKIKEQWSVLSEDRLYDVSLYQVIAGIVQCMDLGLMGMNIDTRPKGAIFRASDRYNEEFDLTSYNNALYTMPKAGEFSQFILPLRYRDMLPALKFLLKFYGDDPHSLEIGLEKFAQLVETHHQSDPEYSAKWLAKNLMWFFEELSACGQTIDDWLFLTESLDKCIEPNWYEDEIVDIDSKIDCLTNQTKYLMLFKHMI